MNKRPYFRKTPKIIHTKTQIIILGIICFFGIIIFYYLLMLLRLGTGIALNLSISDNKNILISLGSSTSFYDFITAIFAAIYGLSIFLKYLFKPIRFFKSRISSFKKYAIVSDTSILFTGFYLIVVKAIFLISLIFCGVFPNELKISEYNYIWILFAIVMYLELWKTILLIYGRKAIYKMILIAFVIIPFSYGLNKVTSYDFNQIYKTVKENQVDYKYQIEYPKSTYYKRSERYRRELNFVLDLGYHRNNKRKDSFPNMLYLDKEITLNNISEIITNYRKTISIYEISRVVVNISADKQIKMKYINQLKDTLYKYNMQKIKFKVIPINLDSDIKFLLEYSLPEKIVSKLIRDEHKKVYKKSTYKIHIFNKDSIFVNDKLQELKKDQIIKYLKNHTSKAVVLLTLDGNATLDDFIFIKSNLTQIYYDLRNEYCLNLNLYSFDYLINIAKRKPRNKSLRNKIIQIREKYPMRILYDY